MRLISLNAWGGQVWPALGDWAEGAGADVLFLQEVIRAPGPSPEWLIYRDPHRELWQRANLFADIAKRLPSHQARFAAAARGALEDPQGDTHASEHGLGAWFAPNLAITEAFQGFVHGSYRHGGWGAEPVPRTLQLFRVCDPTTGGVATVGHLHGLRDPSGKGDTPARRAQARRLADAIERFRRPGDPVIIAGDLNVLPDSETFGILAEIGLTDLVTTTGHTDTRTSLYPKEQRFADYLLVSDNVQIRHFDVPAQPEVSDHRMLIVDFDI